MDLAGSLVTSSAGPAIEEAQRPNTECRCRSMNSWWQPADCRCWWRAMSEVWMQQSIMYCGALCCRHRWTVAHSLYCTRWGTSSQYSSSCRKCESPWSYCCVSLTTWIAAFIQTKSTIEYWRLGYQQWEIITGPDSSVILLREWMSQNLLPNASVNICQYVIYEMLI